MSLSSLQTLETITFTFRLTLRGRETEITEPTETGGVEHVACRKCDYYTRTTREQSLVMRGGGERPQYATRLPVGQRILNTMPMHA